MGREQYLIHEPDNKAKHGFDPTVEGLVYTKTSYEFKEPNTIEGASF
jgi:hypothetical protein